MSNELDQIVARIRQHNDQEWAGAVECLRAAPNDWLKHFYALLLEENMAEFVMGVFNDHKTAKLFQRLAATAFDEAMLRINDQPTNAADAAEGE